MHLSTLQLVAIMAFQFVLLAAVVGFSAPGSGSRLSTLCCSIGLMLVSVFSEKPSYDSSLRLFMLSSSALLVMQHLNIAIIRRWDFDCKGPTERRQQKPQKEASSWDRVAFGFYAAISHRYCGQPFEIDNVPKFRTRDPEFVPSRRRFLVERGLLLLSIYLALDLLGTLGDQNEENTGRMETRQPVFSSTGELTFQNVLKRSIGVAMVWLCGLFIVTLQFGVPGYLMVLFGLSKPGWWRPMFNLEHGMPYSVRRFWSHFWHLIIKDGLYQPARLVSDQALGLRQGSLVRRYTIIFLTFANSGLLHLLVDLSLGVPLWKSRSMLFFLCQALAIMFEDAAMFVLLPTSEKAKKQSRKFSAWQIWIGRMWVATFLYWTTPTWVMPSAEYGGNNDTVSFSVIKAFKGKRQR